MSLWDAGPGTALATEASGSATLANTQVMIEAIRDFYLATGIAIGMKPAGGIRNARCVDAWARDEWDVAVQSNSEKILYRIYRELRSGAWFVEGLYD